ncbi:MAG: P1 family peptidase [Dehalococcoidia bacterium]|nr:P1 family peptidase [Dehalococcoidia bacterium]
MTGSITHIEGIEVGHHTDLDGGTGCTVVLCRQGAVAGVDVRGGAPGTRETDLLGPGRLVQQVHGVLLSGGSAFGLDSAAGVMQYLEERGSGYTMGRRVIPIVPAAIIFDLNLLSDAARPSPKDAYAACERASNGAVDEGSVGAGTGATVAKGRGMRWAIKGGIGTASHDLPGDIRIGAIIAVNSYGGVCDPGSGRVIAGPRLEDGAGMMDPVEAILNGPGPGEPQPGVNTTIGVVATNATLTKDEAHYLARVAHDGLALAIRPCHTMADGDSIFALATGAAAAPPNMTQLGVAATQVVAEAVVRAVQSAVALGGIPAVREL